MWISYLTRTLHQFCCEILFIPQVIFKSMRVADDTFYRTSEREWVKLLCVFAKSMIDSFKNGIKKSASLCIFQQE